MATTLKFFPVAYNPPSTPDMAVVMVFFNPAQSVRIIQNITLVKTLLERANIPYFIGEVAFKKHAHIFAPAENVFQYRSESYMFYKENLVNLVVSRLPPQYTKVTLIDADICFAEADWYNVVSKKLNDNEVIQPYNEACYLNNHFHTFETKKSYAASPGNGHNGFAWSFQRAWLQANPLFEYAIIGGGDTMLKHRLIQKPLQVVHKLYEKEFNKYNPGNLVQIGFCQLKIYHLPHGTLENRQYGTRTKELTTKLGGMGIGNISDVLRKREDGLLEWKESNRTALNSHMMAYFTKRNDDA
jgi:hypothetical protein